MCWSLQNEHEEIVKVNREAFFEIHNRRLTSRPNPRQDRAVACDSLLQWLHPCLDTRWVASENVGECWQSRGQERWRLGAGRTRLTGAFWTSRLNMENT